MSTFMAKPETVTRVWHLLDAAGISLGHTAAQAAVLLRGKHKPEFTPHVDTGDFVVIVNAEKAVLTGRKLEQKVYRTHSGYIGGLKETKYRLLMQDRPEFA
ncbi:MAG: 50S ribosomal protein L13, partial [Oscillospiraceae bacterium]|nr:50S ribosomal protein L13 [Oscillospiraceae bacterium]